VYAASTSELDESPHRILNSAPLLLREMRHTYFLDRTGWICRAFWDRAAAPRAGQ